MPPRLMPPNRGTDAHTEALRRLVSRGSLVDRFNHTHPQICRIWLGHGAFQKPNRPPRLGLSEPLGNPDSIPTETALAEITCTRMGVRNILGCPLKRAPQDRINYQTSLLL